MWSYLIDPDGSLWKSVAKYCKFWKLNTKKGNVGQRYSEFQRFVLPVSHSWNDASKFIFKVKIVKFFWVLVLPSIFISIHEVILSKIPPKESLKNLDKQNEDIHDNSTPESFMILIILMFLFYIIWIMNNQ